MAGSEMVDIIITGANGQLGKELVRKLGRSHSVIGLGKKIWILQTITRSPM